MSPFSNTKDDNKKPLQIIPPSNNTGIENFMGSFPNIQFVGQDFNNLNNNNNQPDILMNHKEPTNHNVLQQVELNTFNNNNTTDFSPAKCKKKNKKINIFFFFVG